MHVWPELRRQVRFAEFSGEDINIPRGLTHILAQKKSQSAARDHKLDLVGPEFEGGSSLDLGLRQASFHQRAQLFVYPHQPDVQLACIERRHP